MTNLNLVQTILGTQSHLNSPDVEETQQVTYQQEGETLEDVAREMIDAYIEEAVKHFLKTRSRYVATDGRYFYAKEELEIFKERFVKEGGDLDKLHCGIVWDHGKFFCYEVCRKMYYEKQKELGEDSCFFSDYDIGF